MSFFEFLKIVPKSHLSHWVGELVHSSLPAPLSQKSVKWFAKFYNINLSEAEFPIENYSSIGEFFSRRLRPGVRPIGEGFVHPCDAVVSQAGLIHEDTLVQCKGKSYSLEKLVRSQKISGLFRGGAYITYYLCPTDYHRVHFPVEGWVRESVHIPGELWPVNNWSVSHIDELFTVNERVVTLIESGEFGFVAPVMVGATNVGRITMSYDSNLVSNEFRGSLSVRKKISVSTRSYEPRVAVRRGEEMGTFHMGSTVILLLSSQAVQTLQDNANPEIWWNQLINRTTRVGETLQGQS